MNRQCDFSPLGLTREQFEQLTASSHHARHMTLAELRTVAQGHLEATARAHQQNPMVNLRLATAICEVVDQIGLYWDDLSPDARAWLGAAILYFAQSDDDEPDFTSPIGFEDDAEVLNASLRFAQLDALCVHPEDYDDV